MVLSPHVLDEICLRTFNGESQRSICRDPDMPSRERLVKELLENSDFAAKYTRARDGMYQAWAEEILEISDDSTTDYVMKVGRNGHEYEAVDQEHIQRSRLRVDSRKWLLSKLLPKTYGDNVKHEHEGEVTHRVDITDMTEREKMRRMALFMLEDQAAAAVIEGTSHPVDQPAMDDDGTESHHPDDDDDLRSEDQ